MYRSTVVYRVPVFISKIDGTRHWRFHFHNCTPNLPKNCSNFPSIRHSLAPPPTLFRRPLHGNGNETTTRSIPHFPGSTCLKISSVPRGVRGIQNGTATLPVRWWTHPWRYFVHRTNTFRALLPSHWCLNPSRCNHWNPNLQEVNT